MGCHCREISIMRQDISQIENTISKLNSIKIYSEEILTSIRKSADNLRNNIDITNKERVISSLNDLCKDEPGEIEKIMDNWSDFKRKLERRLEEMKRSDRRYHEAQRRKRNKHND
ncbi:MAG: hypothetical protein ACI398_06995 [Clostridium sp.]